MIKGKLTDKHKRKIGVESEIQSELTLRSLSKDNIKDGIKIY